VSVIWDDACAQAAAIRSGDTSAVELLEHYLGRIDDLDTDLRAYVSVDRAGALDAARTADELVRRVHPHQLPPFLGVTLSVKDVTDVAGLRTTHSCKALVDNVAAADDPIVHRFRHAGFVILGKTNVPEFCTTMTSSELNGICRNPWDRQRTPGGSSGGAAAALAAGLCAVSHGTDGAGSVRSPASFCGLVGVKPTRGHAAFGPDHGNAYFGTTEDGVLTRSVRDAAHLLDVLTNPVIPHERWSPSPESAYADEVGVDPGPLRIAVSWDAPFGEVDDEIARATRAVADLLEELGHHVEQATPSWPSILAAAAGPMSVPGPAALVAPEEYHLVEPRNLPLLEAGARLTVLEHSRWVDLVRESSRQFLSFWDAFDVLLTPTAGIVAPSVSWAPWDQTPAEHMATFMTFPNFAQPFNLSGQPAFSLPLAWSTSGLPIGMQLAGRPLGEATLVRLAAQLEAARPWADRRPAL
jgi:amidase